MPHLGEADEERRAQQRDERGECDRAGDADAWRLELDVGAEQQRQHKDAAHHRMHEEAGQRFGPGRTDALHLAGFEMLTQLRFAGDFGLRQADVLGACRADGQQRAAVVHLAVGQRVAGRQRGDRLPLAAITGRGDLAVGDGDVPALLLLPAAGLADAEPPAAGVAFDLFVGLVDRQAIDHHGIVGLIDEAALARARVLDAIHLHAEHAHGVKHGEVVMVLPRIGAELLKDGRELLGAFGRRDLFAGHDGRAVAGGGGG